MSLPLPEYGHLLELIDDTGIYEHSRFGVPRREHGYTLDDAARALIVLTEAVPTESVVTAQGTVLAFVLDSITHDGRFRNRLSYSREWQDWNEDDSGDAHGRGVWALCTAAAANVRPDRTAAARSALQDLVSPESPYLRPLAYAALGAHALWRRDRHDPMAVLLAQPVAERLGSFRPPWPEPRLAYANARIPAAMLACGAVLDDPDLMDRGLETLDWLVAVEQTEGHFSFTPVGGWAPGEPRPGFDQQPLEAAAMSDACLRAWQLTGERRWREAVLACGAWLMGENDGRVPLYDPDTGATRDGLMIDGVNLNSGAESTISGIAVLQDCALVTDMSDVGRIPLGTTP
jgi:hypothetical protein